MIKNAYHKSLLIVITLLTSACSTVPIDTNYPDFLLTTCEGYPTLTSGTSTDVQRHLKSVKASYIECSTKHEQLVNLIKKPA